MIQLITPDSEVFHEAEEILRFFIGMEEVRPYSGDCSDVTRVIQIKTHKNESAWIAKSFLQNSDKIYSGQCRIKTPDHWGIKRAKGRAVKFSMYRLLKELYPTVATPWGCLTGIRPTKILYEYAEEQPIEEVESILLNGYGISSDRVALLLDIYNAQIGFRKRLPADCVDLYTGIPFCPTRCDYCSFASNPLKKFGHFRDEYLNALFKEADVMMEYLAAKRMRVGTLYIGGGTPTALEASQLKKLLEHVSIFRPLSKEFTLEAGRPDTITQEKLSLAHEYGVNRISINPQTMHDYVLRVIGRNHTVEEIIQAYELARRLGFDWINMDLIAGLPGENEALFEETIRNTINLKPENITVHTLSIKRSSKMRDIMNTQAKLDGTDVCNMVDNARMLLQENGWAPYYLYRQKYMSQNLENVGYSIPGKQCLYNVNVMEETHSNVALGAGAITKWYNPLTNVIKRSPNVKNLSEYILRSEEMARKSIAVANDVLQNET